MKVLIQINQENTCFINKNLYAPTKAEVVKKANEFIFKHVNNKSKWLGGKTPFEYKVKVYDNQTVIDKWKYRPTIR